MASATATVASFTLYSGWTTSGGRITSGPTEDTASKTFTISGIPEGMNIDSVVVSANFIVPSPGAQYIQMNGETVDDGPQSVSVQPTADGNGNYTVTFAFKSVGKANLSDGSHGISATVSNPTLTVFYSDTEPEPSPDPGPDPGPEPEPGETGTATATTADFYLYSSWTNANGRITNGPILVTATKVFTVSGVPSGARILSVKLSATYTVPTPGAKVLQVNSTPVGTGAQTVDLEPTEDGNGEYTVIFKFQTNGNPNLSDGNHGISATISGATVTVTYTTEPAPQPQPEPVVNWSGDKPISVFPAQNTTSFNNNGAAVLHPTYGRMKTVAGGTCEINMRHPIDEDGKWTYLVPGAIVRVPVPEETIENAFIGIEVDLYRTNTSAALRESPSEPTSITYSEWNWQTQYSVGSKVTCTGQGNYQCVAYDGTSQQIMVPPYANPSWWKQIPSKTSGAAVLVQLSSGEDLYYLENAGSGWYKMSTPMGIEGYIKSSQVTYIRHVTPQESSERTIRDQLFRISSVTIDNKAMEVTVYAKHVSYDMAAILVRDVKLSKAMPSMAINRVLEGLMMEYRGTVSTNLSTAENGTYTGQINGKNGIFAFLDPENGIVPTFNARFTRDNWDLFVLKKTNTNRGVRIKYGKNLKGLTWKRSSENMVTRIVPVAKDEKGNDLYLPEKYIDSPNIGLYPVIMMQRLAVKGQVGKDDGTETNTKWTADALYNEMRAKANERYSVDHADELLVEITIDFESWGNAVGYELLKNLEHVLLYDTITAEDERIGLETQLTVTEMEWDFIRKKIVGIKVANSTASLRTVAGYNIDNNSIGTEKLTEAAITEIANLLS